jgi:hypothetical protein
MKNRHSIFNPKLTPLAAITKTIKTTTKTSFAIAKLSLIMMSFDEN